MKFALSIVLVTVCRDSLLRAVRSIFAQTFPGSMQVLVGVDRDPNDRATALEAELRAACPPHISMTWINLGYSTAKKYGGVHKCSFGGSLRSALTFLANSEYVMYLDDDDWLKENHVELILKVIPGKKWAYSYSIYADGNLSQGLCPDEWESVGVGKGAYKAKFGGFVRPSGMAINKLEMLDIVHLWSCSPTSRGDGEDRLVFSHLRGESNACTEQPTVYYSLDPRDGMHPVRVQYMQSKGITCTIVDKQGSVR